MWSSDRRRFLAIAACGLIGACGFEPVYGPGGAGTVLAGRLRPDAPRTPDEYVLVREIETRLGRADAPDLSLGYATSVTEERMAISSSNITTRFNVIGTVEYRVTDTVSGVVLSSGRVNSFTSYSATGSTVATQAARRDARERLMGILVDLLIARLIADAESLAP